MRREERDAFVYECKNKGCKEALSAIDLLSHHLLGGGGGLIGKCAAVLSRAKKKRQKDQGWKSSQQIVFV